MRPKLSRLGSTVSLGVSSITRFTYASINISRNSSWSVHQEKDGVVCKRQLGKGMDVGLRRSLGGPRWGIFAIKVYKDRWEGQLMFESAARATLE